jgi:hypothetical protein
VAGETVYFGGRGHSSWSTAQRAKEKGGEREEKERKKRSSPKPWRGIQKEHVSQGVERGLSVLTMGMMVEVSALPAKGLQLHASLVKVHLASAAFGRAEFMNSLPG